MMPKPTEALPRPANPRDRIIVALDVDSAEKACAIVGELRGHVGAFKVGLQLFAAAGPQLVREFTSSGVNIFLDLKFHDIPNTVAKASVEAARLGVWMFNIHASGGSHMMKQTAAEVDEACGRENLTRPLIIGVTVLTSANVYTINEVGVAGDIESQVVRLARLASTSGLDGVVASPQEVTAIRNAVSDRDFMTVTPGIRPLSATDDDQKRVTTFGRAMASGSDYVVIGRPIVQAKDRLAAVEQIIAEV